MVYNHTIDLPQPYNKIGDGPEGPEVRTVADRLSSKLVSLTMMSFRTYEKAKVSGLERLTLPCTITSVSTFGKKIIIGLSDGLSIIVSLGMTGSFKYSRSKHSHVEIKLFTTEQTSRGVKYKLAYDLYYDDPRNFGHLDVIDDSEYDEYFKNIGPDLMAAAINEEIDYDSWIEIFRGRKKNSYKQISQVLLDQSIVSGIGNYLKSEILYSAKIDPFRLVSSLTLEELEDIRVAAHKIILRSYKCGGFTFESFVDPDGGIGRYNSLVYGKEIDPLGNEIVKDVGSDKRSTYWVPDLQK